MPPTTPPRPESLVLSVPDTPIQSANVRQRDDSESPQTESPTDFSRFPKPLFIELPKDPRADDQVYPFPPGVRGPGNAPIYVKIYDILRLPVPVAPHIYAEKVLQGTRGPTLEDFELGTYSDDVLEQVVVFHPLVDQLRKVGKIWLQRLPELNLRDPLHSQFLASIHPGCTAQGLSPIINSENDSVAWIINILIRPVLAIAKQFPNGHLLAYTQVVEHPSASSCTHGDCIPDGILSNPDGKKCLVMEWKTHAALKGGENGSFSELFTHWPGMPLGMGMRYRWPHPRSPAMDTKDKILLQVWTQMINKEVDLAMLSSYETTIFFRREGNTLYMSAPYTRANHVAFAVYCFLIYACGYISRDAMWLPPVRTDWWPTPPSRLPGLDQATYPEAYLGRTEKRKHDQRWIV